MTEKNETLTTAADAAAFIERKADDYAREFGTNDMGSLSFGNEDMRIYHWHLSELADEIRELAAPSASAQQAQPVAWYDGNKFYGSEMAAALDRSGPVRPVYYAAPAPSASPDTVGVILEMREQAREARQSDPDAGIFADHAYADLLDEWANRLERHDGRMSGLVRDYIEGMSVSIDVSTGEHDAGNRYYGFVSEVMDDPDDKHGVTLLVQDDVRPNFKVSASPAALTDEREVKPLTRFVTYLNDHCIGQTITEESLGEWLLDVLDSTPRDEPKHPPKSKGLFASSALLAASPADQVEDAR